jgi:uncharacterized protein (DUF58 family)
VVGSASILGAYATNRRELLYVGLLALLLPLIAVAFARLRRVSVGVTRTFRPRIVGVAQPAAVELTVTNLAPFPTPELTWRDARPWTFSGDGSQVMPSLTARRSRSLATGNQTRLRYALTAPRRGEFEIGPLSVMLADPFGLATGEVAIGDVDRLIVTPALRDLPDTGLAILASDGVSKLVRRAIGGDDDLSTREYRTGDAMRRVHWRATARHGELMVRQEEPGSHAEARIILDTRRSGYSDRRVLRHHDDAESAAFEFALSLAASIALDLARSGFAVELVETGRPQLEPVMPLVPFLRALATIELSQEHGDYRPGVDVQASRSPDRAHGSVFAIVSDVDAPMIERLAVQRPGFDLAVAFVIASPDPRAREMLSDTGWTCVVVRAEDTVEGAWRSLAQVHGARHGR